MVSIVNGVIGTILYPLFSVIFLFIDGIQALFYAFAGIGDITLNSGTNFSSYNTITSGNSGQEGDTGIVYYFLQHNIVKNLILSIMLLALFLVIIFTVMAFIKNAYAAKQKGWKEIIGNAIKGLANFILVPVCSLLAVWLGNILLNAVNGATSYGSSASMSRKLFIASAYNANEFRAKGQSFVTTERIDELRDWAGTLTLIEGNGYYDASKIKSGQSAEYYATIVDEIYGTTNVGIWNQVEVGKYYQVFNVNYLVIAVGGLFMLYVLCSLAFAMVRRMFMIIILFIISPGVCALYPLDEGKAVGSWKGEFTKQVLSAYGAVAGMNIFFALMPLISQIQIYGVAGTIFGLNELIQIFILVVGLLCVKEVIGFISNFVGGEDAYGKGAGLMKSSMDSIKKYRDKTVKATSKFVGYAAPVAKGLGKGLFNVGKGVGQGLGTIGGAIGSRVKHGAIVAGQRISDAADKSKVKRYARKHGLKDLYDPNDDHTVRDLMNADLERRAIEKKEKKDLRMAKWNSFKDGAVGLAHKAGDLASGAAHKVGDFASGVAGKVRDSKAGVAIRQASFDRKEKRAKESMYRDLFDELDEEKLMRDWAKADNKRRTANMFKDIGKGFGQIGGAVGEQLKKAPGGLKRMAGAMYAETGLENWTGDNVVKPYKGVGDRQAIRDKKAGAGRAGTGKAGKNLDALEASVGVEAMSAQVIQQLGDAIGAAVWRQKDLSKFAGFGSAKDRLGLGDSSSIDDLKDADGVLSKLASYATRLSKNNLDEQTKRAILEDAIKYARETDSNGNDKLQDALDSALKTFLSAEKQVKIDKVTLDGTAAGEMIKASKEAAQAMAKYFKENITKIANAVEAEQRKDKK